MFGAYEYIRQQFTDGGTEPWYSEVLHTRSAVVGGVNQVQVDYGEWGALYILVTGISFTSIALATTGNFTDQFGRTILTLRADPSSTGWYDTTYVIKAQTLIINYAVPDPDAVFVVQHQYLREVDIKSKR